jgi:hypothetical protein
MLIIDMDYLHEIKNRLNIKDNEYDKIILSYLNEMIFRIKFYCSLEFIPITLDYTVVSSTIDYLLSNKALPSDVLIDRSQSVSSLTIGGFTEKFSSSSDTSSVVNKTSSFPILDSYKSSLDAHRCLKIL